MRWYWSNEVIELRPGFIKDRYQHGTLNSTAWVAYRAHVSVNLVSILKHQHGLVTDCHQLTIAPIVLQLGSAADVSVKLQLGLNFHGVFHWFWAYFYSLLYNRTRVIFGGVWSRKLFLDMPMLFCNFSHISPSTGALCNICPFPCYFSHDALNSWYVITSYGAFWWRFSSVFDCSAKGCALPKVLDSLFVRRLSGSCLGYLHVFRCFLRIRGCYCCWWSLFRICYYMHLGRVPWTEQKFALL